MSSRIRRRPLCLAAAAGLAVGSFAFGQAAPDPSREVKVPLDTGVLDLGVAPVKGQEHVLAWTEEVRVAGSNWLRVHFGTSTVLPGPDRRHGGAYVVITSAADGAKHILDAASLPQWDRISAFMNGDQVTVQLYVVPGSGTARVTVDKVTAGIPSPVVVGDTICGATDDRVPHNDPRTGRLSTGCTGWLITRNGTANEYLSAGHCISNGQAGAVMRFNCPPSTAGGAAVNPPPEFQFPVQAASIQSFDSGAVGDEFSRFYSNNNSNTGLPARIAQGQGAFFLAASAPAGGVASTTVYGHGVVNDPGPPPVPNEWNVINKVHTAPYSGKVGTRINYLTDTDNGNSGSPVTQVIGFVEQAIGIHTDGFCPGTFNSGTAVDHAGLQAALAGPSGIAFPHDSTVYKLINTTFASNNGGDDGGSIFFDVVTGVRSIEVTHINLNINRQGVTSNTTPTEDDDFFNFDVYIRPGTAAGFQTSPAGWTLVAEGAGMPKPEDTVTVGALKSTFTLNGSQSYGVAIVFDAGAAHAYTDGTGSNETYSNTDLSITGISSSNTAFGAVFSPRVFNGGLGYHLNEATGQCLETIYATNNGGSNGGMVYFNVLTGSSPVTITGLSSNVSGAGGLNCNLTLFRKNGGFAGFEATPAAWTQVATAAGTSAAADAPSFFPLNTFVTLNASTLYAFAIQLNTSGAGTDGHVYTNGTGLNQSYQDNNLTLTFGSASNAPFGTTITSRVWNGSLCYGRALSPCASRIHEHQPPNHTLAGLNSTPGAQEEADSFVVAQNQTLNGATLWGAYSTPDQAPVNQDFVLNFHANAGGLPGALVATRAVANVAVKDTGLVMAGFGTPIYQYDLSFAGLGLAPGTYWLAALGNEPGFTWGWARINNTASAHAFRNGVGAWSLSAGDFAYVLCGSLACYPNCDGSTQAPFLNVADFTCFLTRYAAGDVYANCDGSTQAPVLNVADFTCFLGKYATGCGSP